MTKSLMKNKRQRAHRYGLTSEKIAAFYLRGKGYRILAERYRNAQGEIDLLAAKGNTLIAVEVKARKTLAACEESITPWKQQKVMRTVQGFLAGHAHNQRGSIGLADLHERDIRFDVIWIAPWCWPKHIKDAWRL